MLADADPVLIVSGMLFCCSDILDISKFPTESVSREFDEAIMCSVEDSWTPLRLLRSIII